MQPNSESKENLMYMNLIDHQYTRTPFYGSRRMKDHFRHSGHRVNRKRIQRLMRLMGLEAIYPKPNLSRKDKAHTIYPYLLRNVTVTDVNQVWSADITYIPMVQGFMYLVAIIDWYSRYVLSWRLSNTLDVDFCLEALEEALSNATPDIFNTDQGSQFTSLSFTGRLIKEQIKISMDGRGRALDNIFVERLWRSVKYEDIYIKDYESVPELYFGLDQYFRFYNHERPHQSLDGQTPEMVYHGCGYLQTA
jgi:putative transposase